MVLFANMNVSSKVALVYVLASEMNTLVVQSIAKASTGKENSVIYLSMRTPSSLIVKELDKLKVNYKNIHMIDAMGKPIVNKNVHIKYVESPAQLTEISVLLNFFLKNSTGKTTLIIDSVSAMRQYVMHELMVKFMHFVITRARSLGVTTIILADKSDEDNVQIRDIAQYCDIVKK